MKKRLLLCFFGSLYILAHGQIAFTAKGGLNINDLSGKNIPDELGELYSSHTGFHVGVGGLITLADKLMLIPDLQYIQRGADYKNFSNSLNSSFNVEYLELPVCLSYNVVWGLHVDVGASLSYKIKAYVREEGDNHDVNEFIASKLEFGVSAGLRYDITKRIALLGRYYYGMTPVLTFMFIDFNNVVSNGAYYNRNVQVGLSYRMGKV